MNSFKEVSKTELEILEILWASNKPRSFGWLLAYFNDNCGKQWKRQTLSTHLKRLSCKGTISSKNIGKTSEYTPIMSKVEYESFKAQNLLDKSYKGSLRNFMVALYDGKSVSSSDMSELKSWLEEQEKGSD